MLVEISGIDGSGKTSLANAVAGRLLRQGVTCYQHRLKPPSRRVLSDIAAPSGKSKHSYFGAPAVELVSAYELLMMARTLLTNRVADQVQIVEPYVLACLAIAHGRGVRELEPLATLLAAAPAPDLSVRLDIPIETAFDRISARAQGDIALISYGRKRLEAYHAGLVAAQNLPRYETTTMDSGNTSVDALAEMVCDRISRKMNG